MNTNLLEVATNGHTAARMGFTVSDCPHYASSTNGAAWLFGFSLGAGTLSNVKKIAQSRGCNLRVWTYDGGVSVVPYPTVVAPKTRTCYERHSGNCYCPDVAASYVRL